MSGACAHCGLPVGRRPVTVARGEARGTFCCYGCVLARQVAGDDGDDGRLAAVVVRLTLAGFLTANVLMVSMPSWVPAFYGSIGTDGPGFVLLRWLALALGAPVIGLLGWPIMRAAGRPVRLLASAEGLVLLGAIAAWTLSLVHVVRGRTEIFVDTACLLLVFVTVGRLVEARARARVGAALGAADDPAAAPAARRCGATWQVIPAGELRPDDVVRVGPGGRFPADGVVEAGSGGVDEAILTGEPRPVPIGPGQRVAGGALSVDGTFDVRIESPVGESARARIEGLVRDAVLAPTRGERLADRAASVLVPVATGIALAAGLWWWHHAGIDRGLMVALAVLVVACPCALGIATPAAIATALARAARRGVLVRSGEALERLAAVEAVAFDKTGTLTDAVPAVASVRATGPDGPSETGVLALAAAVERDQPHPFARAIVRAARARAVAVAPATDVRLRAGRGAQGVVEGHLVVVERREDGRGTRVLLDGLPVGTIAVAERLREGAGEALAAVRALGLEVLVLSGDRSAIALRSLVPDGALRLGLDPEAKLATIRALEAEHRRGVAMVGDGLNDAPPLAAARVGIATGSATDLARRSADVVLLADDLGRVPWLIGLARATRRVLRQNLAWAAVYNAGALGAAATGALSPLVAATVMLASSITIVANSRRLGRTASGQVEWPAAARRREGNLEDDLAPAPAPAGEMDAAAVRLDYLPTHR